MAKKEKKNRKRGFFNKLFRFTYKSVIFVFILLIILSSFLYVTFRFEKFRKPVVHYVVEKANDFLLADIKLGDIRVHSLKYIQLKEVLVTVRKDTFLYARHINLHFNPLSFTSQRYRISQVKLEDAVVKMKRSKTDSLWNYTLIAPPSEKKKKEQKKINLVIDISDIQLKNSRFIYQDSIRSKRINGEPDYPHIDFTDFEFYNIFTDIDGVLTLADNNFDINIDQVKTKEKYTGLDLEDMSAKVILNEEGIFVRDMSVTTPRSNLDMSADLENLSIFNHIDISKVNFKTKMKASPVDVRDALYFAFTGPVIHKVDKFDIETEGTLNNLHIKKANMKKGNTDFHASGYIKNILDIHNFNYKMNIKNSSFRRSDIISIIPEFENIIPKVDRFEVKSMYADGYLDSVHTEFDINSSEGNAVGTAEIMYLNNMNYFVDIKTEEFNLAPFVKNESLQSSISGNIYIKGSGIKPENIKAEISADIYNSQISGYDIIESKLKANSMKDKFISLDSLYLKLPKIPDEFIPDNADIFEEEISNLFVSGWLDLNKDIPEYNINANISAIDIADLIKNENMPEHLSSKIMFKGKGLQPDDLEGDFNMYFSEILFADRALYPFSVDAKISHPDSITKNISLNSEYFNIDLFGQFTFDDLITNLDFQRKFVTDYIYDKTNIIAANDTIRNTLLTDEEKHNYKFPNINANLKAEIKDISPITAFMRDMDIYLSSSLNLNFYSDSTINSINIDSLYIKNLEIVNNGKYIYLNPQLLNSALIIEKDDSLNKLSQIGFNLEESSDIVFDGHIIDSAKVALTFSSDNISYKFRALYNHEIFASLEGESNIENREISFDISDLKFLINDIIDLENKDKIQLLYSNGDIAINNFDLNIDSTNSLQLGGLISLLEPNEKDDNTQLFFHDLNLNLKYIGLQKYTKFLSEDLQQNLASLNADLTNFDLTLNGNIDNLDVAFKSSVENLRLQGFPLGEIQTDFKLNNKNIFGKALIIGDNKKEYLNMRLNQFGLNDDYIPDSLSRINAQFTLRELPLPLLSPFIPMINELTGTASADISVTDYTLDPNINGNLDLKSTSFILENNNIKYFADGNVKFTKDLIETNDFELKNTKRDSQKGKALVDATIKLENFVPEYFDISVKASNFKLLGDASADVMPNLYGDLIITTGNNPLSFTGTLQDPLLAGDVNVVTADLKMPEFSSQTEKKTQLRYQIVGEKVRHQIINRSDSLVRIEKEKQFDIMKELDFDMHVKLLGKVAILIDLGTLGEIYADLTMQNKDEQIIYTKNTEKGIENLSGQIILKESSTFKSFKVLQTKGDISFPTGEIDNPSLNLTATYKGTTIMNNQPTQYTVIMYITGSQSMPNVRFTYTLDGQEATGDPKKIEEDAILLLVAGRTKSSSSEGAANTDMLQQSLNSGISNYGSQLLTDFLIKTGSIQSVDLDFKGEGFDEATVKFTGQTELFGGSVNWTIGGSLADFSNNNEIILDVPLANYTENDFWRNFIFQFTKASHTNTTIQDQNAKNWEIKFKVGGSF